MTVYKRKPTNNSFNKGGGGKKFTPGLKEGFNNFLTSLVKLPFGMLASEELLDLDAIKKFLASDGKKTLRGLIVAAIGAKSDDVVEDATAFIFEGASDASKVYNIDCFVKFQEYGKNEDYKKANLDYAEMFKSIFGLK